MKLHAGIPALLAVLLMSGAALGGSICGTVRDAVTGEAIPRAGVFLRAPTGEYTGLHGATDEAGFYCIDLVPVGTWDLEVRVDDYEVAWVRGIEVTDGPSAVDVELDGAVFRFAPPWPNPTQEQVWFRLRIGEPAPVRLLVYDLAGRLVRSWSDPAADPGERVFAWDLRDGSGRQVPAGVYLVHFTARDSRLVRRLVAVR